jgi:DNA mismatch repair protein MutL
VPRIHTLPNHVVNKIAAGEVIERPSSVVKELVENSVDAGARRIEVELDQGGAELIRVVDDGHGIEPDDLVLALASHATSKLRDAEDLFRVATLGFRGEALASIAGVARVVLQSRAAGFQTGAEVTCDGGEMSAVRPWSGPAGTRVEVRQLFYNTPVRRKFLKAPATEIGHVNESMTRLALARPDLHLVLRHNGRKVLEAAGGSTLAERVRHIFGKELADALYAVDAAQGNLRLRGQIADPAQDRGTAKFQYLFVNGRWFRDRSLGHALQEAYRGLLLGGRYAASFLFVELPPDLVDVNVHPTKAEVRFREPNQVYHLLLATVRERLRKAQLTPRLVVPEPAGWPVLVARPPAPAAAPPAPAEAPGPWDEPAGARRGDGPPKAIQLHDAYIVVETGDGMLVIDQHALHERILFEQLRQRVAAGDLERQRLLIPEPIDLPADQAARVLEAKAELTELGLDVEEFGGGTVVLHSYPAILGRAQPGALFRDVADRLAAKDRPPTRDQLLEHLLATMACRAAVKAGDRLTPDEVNELVAQRELAENSHHCPHGRPTTLAFTRKELDKQFRRT